MRTLSEGVFSERFAGESCRSGSSENQKVSVRKMWGEILGKREQEETYHQKARFIMNVKNNSTL